MNIKQMKRTSKCKTCWGKGTLTVQAGFGGMPIINSHLDTAYQTEINCTCINGIPEDARPRVGRWKRRYWNTVSLTKAENEIYEDSGKLPERYLPK